MDDKGEILSSCDVDENIGLQIWTKGFSPRLVIFNKNQNSKKLIRLSWLENLERKLSIKGKKRGQSVEYSLTGLLPHIQHILAEYAVYTSFKPRLWKFAAVLEKTFHSPAVVLDKGELNLLSEEKRSCLWLADMTGGEKGEGSFRPFFPLLEKEKKNFPEEGLPITGNRRGVDDLYKTGITRKLANQEPLRWHKPLQVISAAVLLAFSFCYEDGSDFADGFWADEIPPLKIDDTRLCGLGRKYAGYVRHFSALKEIEMRTSLDSDKELLEANYSRKRRVEFQEKTIGDVAYSVTFFEREEDGLMAFGCKPRAATSRHKGELIYTLPAPVYAQALADNAMDGPADDYYTIAQLASAKAFEQWANTVTTYASSFVGAV